MTTAESLGLRPARPSDADLLYRIYASTREEELSVVPWDAAAKEAFLRMQFTAQDTHYHTFYPDASYDLIVIGDDTAGRLYVHRGQKAWCVIDIALLPGYRGKGIGTRLLTELLTEAAVAAAPVQVHVEKFNPARRLYGRLGFHQVADQGVYLLLQRDPGTTTSSASSGV